MQFHKPDSQPWNEPSDTQLQEALPPVFSVYVLPPQFSKYFAKY